MALLTRVNRWDAERVRQSCMEVRRDLKDDKIHAYFNV